MIKIVKSAKKNLLRNLKPHLPKNQRPLKIKKIQQPKKQSNLIQIDQMTCSMN